MDHLKTRLRVEGLEDRTTPAVSYQEALTIMNSVPATAAEVSELYVTLNDPRTTAEMKFIATRFQNMAAASQINQAMLADFQTTLVSALPANPGLSGLLNQVGTAMKQEQLNAFYAGWMATGFGAVAPPPPTVPPAAPPALPTPPEDASANAPPDIPPVTPPSAELPLAEIPATLSTTIPDVNDPRWQTQANGLKIMDVARGTGPAVAVGNTITVNYRGWLASNGTEFDSSQKAGRTPLTSQLATGQLIGGWVQGVPGMQAGTIRRLYIPSALAYGTSGQGNIPPNADLVFEIQMLSFT